MLPKHSPATCAAGLRFYLRSKDGMPYPVELPLVEDVQLKMKVDDNLRNTLRPGLRAHCSKCLVVWEMMQRITHQPASLAADLAQEKVAEEKRKTVAAFAEISVLLYSISQRCTVAAFAQISALFHSISQRWAVTAFAPISALFISISKRWAAPATATPKVPDFMVLNCITKLQTIEGLYQSIQRLHPEWNVSVETVKALMKSKKGRY
jgi:hypothetical protein